MDRKEYLDRLQRAIVSIAQTGSVDPRDTVVYKGVRYYPYRYVLTCDDAGQWIHLAIIHDLKANSVQQCRLDQLQEE